MIIGIGHDVCSITRMEQLLARFGTRIAKRCLTTIEYADFESLQAAHQAAYLAKRFAAKEAAAKALATGIAHGVTLKDFEISRQLHAQPALRVQGKALEKLQAQAPNGFRCFVSLSDEGGLAFAFVVVEAA